MKLVGKVFGCGAGAGLVLMLIVGFFWNSPPSGASGVLGAPLRGMVIPEQYEGRTNLDRIGGGGEADGNEGPPQVIGGEAFGTGNEGEERESSGSTLGWEVDRSDADTGPGGDLIDKVKLNVCRADGNETQVKRVGHQAPPDLKMEGEPELEVKLIPAKSRPRNDSNPGDAGLLVMMSCIRTLMTSSGSGTGGHPANTSNSNSSNGTTTVTPPGKVRVYYCQMWCGPRTVFFFAWGLVALALLIIVLELLFLIIHILKQEQPVPVHRIYYVEVLEQQRDVPRQRG